MRLPVLLCLLVAVPAVAETPEDPASAAALIAGTAGRWQGELQYRDYQSNTWQGLPMTVNVAVQPDGVTTIRTAQFDDGPKTGTVTITTASLIDTVAATQSYASFRKGRATDVGLSRIVETKPGVDTAHWTIVTIETRTDGDTPAQVRETTIRDGDSMTTLKEVNPANDGVEDWLPRNRSVVRRIGP